MSDLRPPDALEDLKALSARLGSDPLQIQAAGGNTSVKDGAAMWIKASGTTLADAATRDIFVPVDLPAMRNALTAGEDKADQPAEFKLDDTGLRPSIETSLHAVFDQKVVLHTHCVNTIALAIRSDAETVLADRLCDFDWVFVPYCKPGANLARAFAGRMMPDTNVAVLGNHGLLIAADTVSDARDLLAQVVDAVRTEPEISQSPDMAGLTALADDSAYAVPPSDASVHQIALSHERVAAAAGGSLYPDHVIFCGPGTVVLRDRASLPRRDGPVFLIVPGAGALVRKDASSGARALMRCLGDVLMRTDPGATLNYLSDDQNDELMDWDAEKYRKALNAE